MDIFMTSDTDLATIKSKLINPSEYIHIRDKYTMFNRKRFVNGETHRRIMQNAINVAKTVIDHGGTEEEVKNACLYLQICIDARKYRLDHNRAKKDCKIDELISKYVTA